LGALVLASLFIWRPAFLGVLAAAVVIGVWEMTRAVEPLKAQPPLPPLIIGGLAMVALAWFAGIEAMFLGLVLTMLAILIWRLGEGPVGYQRDVTSAVLIAAYVPFLAGFGALMLAPDDGPFRIVATLSAVVLSDTGGYVSGVLFGRHPMAPTVSPKKSWEGFAGSLTASAVGSAIICTTLLDMALWEGAVFGVVIAIVATLGDLGESLLKRDLGVKDMGRLLPGHGGLMDRLDSILLAVPGALWMLSVFAPPPG